MADVKPPMRKFRTFLCRVCSASEILKKAAVFEPYIKKIQANIVAGFSSDQTNLILMPPRRVIWKWVGGLNPALGDFDLH
jgi:hypothetical protein